MWVYQSENVLHTMANEQRLQSIYRNIPKSGAKRFIPLSVCRKSHHVLEQKVASAARLNAKKSRAKIVKIFVTNTFSKWRVSSRLYRVNNVFFSCHLHSEQCFGWREKKTYELILRPVLLLRMMAFSVYVLIWVSLCGFAIRRYKGKKGLLCIFLLSFFIFANLMQIWHSPFSFGEKKGKFASARCIILYYLTFVSIIKGMLTSSSDFWALKIYHTCIKCSILNKIMKFY